VINTKNSEVNGTQNFFKFNQFMKVQILKGQISNFLELHFKNSYDRITRWFKYDRDWFVCTFVQISPGHIWTTLYFWGQNRL